jgi:hypothetical protein
VEKTGRQLIADLPLQVAGVAAARYQTRTDDCPAAIPRSFETSSQPLYRPQVTRRTGLTHCNTFRFSLLGHWDFAIPWSLRPWTLGIANSPIRATPFVAAPLNRFIAPERTKPSQPTERSQKPLHRLPIAVFPTTPPILF